jgi:hypothetical protein
MQMLLPEHTSRQNWDLNQIIFTPDRLQYVRRGFVDRLPLDQSLQSMWPMATLTSLTIGSRGDMFNFNMINLANIWLPWDLRTLVLRGNFNGDQILPEDYDSDDDNNQRILDYIKFPPTLVTLILEGNFDQPLRNIVFPTRLKHLHLGDCFNSSLDGANFPKGLITLIIGNQFDQALDEFIFPPRLKTLFLGIGYELENLVEINFPMTLNTLVVGNKLYRSAKTGIMIDPESGFMIDPKMETQHPYFSF